MTTRSAPALAEYQFVFDGNKGVRFAPIGSLLSPSLRYDVDDSNIARAFGAALSPVLADLVDVALAVYVADRLARRRPAHADLYHPYWTRQMHVRLPVRVPAHWEGTLLGEHLRKLLLFLTEDFWHFEFVERQEGPRHSETMVPLLKSNPVKPVTVALFSGGLDSFAGACHELLDASGGTLVLFSGRTNQRIGARQDLLAGALKRQTRREIRPVIVPFGLRNRNGEYDQDEPSQRSRGFVFPILAAVGALLAGVEEVLVYEPCIGAINLPYTEAQLGAQATRATDPRTLLALSKLISIATNKAFCVRGPFLFETKAELCQNINALGLADWSKETISCDGVSLRVKDHTHCGLCTSCLLRRQGLEGAGLGDLDRRAGIYKDDVLGGPGAVRFEKLHSFRAMDFQVSKLKWALCRTEPWREITCMYPQLVEIAAAVAETGQNINQVEDQIVDLYRRYCDEWVRFRVKVDGVSAA